ncbi:MAG TPA: glycoside hydrolase family 65 protein [Clostridiaceae bacterium]|nr:glycoside hydrolase family 65 protein [Clostridiaceae bacterium]HHV99100.1 glycoside hydrolase family 65 protein [Clostridiaceae bacterium]
MNNWVINQNDFDIQSKKFYESIFSLGNGYMGVRGFDEEEIRDAKHEINTFIAGVFDYYAPGKTDMVNSPNFWCTSIFVNGERFAPERGEILEYNKELNMREGILKRKLIWKNEQGNETLIETTRILSIDSIHNAVLSINITPVNYSGEIVIETGIDADIWNNIIDDDQVKTSTNFCRLFAEDGEAIHIDNIHIIRLKTTVTGLKIYEGFSSEVRHGGSILKLEQNIVQREKYVADKFTFPVAKGEVYTLNKFISVWTSRDKYAGSLEDQVLQSVKTAKDLGVAAMIKNHAAAWERKWRISDIEFVGDNKSQKAIRYNIFQLIQTNAENDPYVNIGARGLMHGRYKGCYFWDTEIFMLPFYIYTNPKAARNLLLYRYHTLNGAEENARRQNVEGARYPWMSAVDGLDQCDTWDIGLSEVHITADVAYAINHYYEATNDIEFMRDFGLEILIQTSRYWKSRFTYDSRKDCYNMLFVKGPNEYGGVVNNNLYTVMMAVHNMQLAKKFIKKIKTCYSEAYQLLAEKLGFKEDEVRQWDEIIEKVVINYDADKSLYLEDDNILNLEPLDLSSVKEGDRPLYRKICFDRLQRYRVLKQADVILLMLLLSDKFSTKEKLAAWNYYEPITAHDSSLSYGTHSAFAARLNMMEEAYKYFIKSVCLDLDNIMQNTQEEGIHFAALGASWQAVINGFCGIELEQGNLKINPHIPKQWEKVSFRMYYHQCLLKVSVSSKAISVTYEEGEPDELQITVANQPVLLLKCKEEIISIR